jgi:RNA polymerase sigma factor (sigma-70 family)
MTTSSFDQTRTNWTLLIRLRDPEDQQAWVEFHTRYAPMIGGWCRRWFPRETEGMVQEVMLVLVKRLRTFQYQPGKLFRGYLKAVTRQLMADLKVKEKQWPMVGSDGLAEDAEATLDLEARLAAEFDLELLEQAKANVRSRVEPKTWRAYVEMAEKGRKGADVAGELGKSVGAVHTARWQVLKLLQEEVKFLEHSCEREVLS